MAESNTSFRDKISTDRNQLQINQSFIEGVCFSNHLYNYLGTISVAVLTAIDMTDLPITILFDKCVGGVCFSLKAENPVFSSLNEFSAEGNDTMLLLSLLADGTDIREDGRVLDLMFAVNGIDQELAMQRQEKLSSYSLQKVKVF
ncbi:MAG: hypothetical protein IJ748_03475 [Bacteroidales bacterium]|nr:hypothetical protein [Bacteroidales bacterium]